MGVMYGDKPLAECNREDVLKAFDNLWREYQELKTKYAELQADYDTYRENF